MSYGSRRAVIGRRVWNERLLDLFEGGSVERVAPDIVVDDQAGTGLVRDLFASIFVEIERDVALYANRPDIVEELLAARFRIATAYGQILGERPPVRPSLGTE